MFLLNGLSLTEENYLSAFAGKPHEYEDTARGVR